MNNVYLDNAATTQVKQEVIDAIIPYLAEFWHNPSSLYKDGVKIKEDIEFARKIIADFINADKDEIYFNSGGSEGNSTAILGFILDRIAKGEKVGVVTTEIEHKSILKCVDFVGSLGCVIRNVKVDGNGFIRIDDLFGCIDFLTLESGVKPENVLVSMQHGNNEIGSVQDIETISHMMHLRGCYMHVDAVQTFGHIPIDVDALGIDMLSASAHKIGGVKGAGFLYKRNEIEIAPIIFGSQEDGLRGGTENVPGIIAMGQAVKLTKDIVKNRRAIELTRDYFIDKLKSIGCMLIGAEIMRLPNNINVMLPGGIGGEEVLYILDLANVKISVGSACNSRAKEPSHVLKAIGLTDDEALRVIRITISPDTTFEEIDYVVGEIKKAIKLLNC